MAPESWRLKTHTPTWIWHSLSQFTKTGPQQRFALPSIPRQVFRDFSSAFLCLPKPFTDTQPKTLNSASHSLKMVMVEQPPQGTAEWGVAPVVFYWAGCRGRMTRELMPVFAKNLGEDVLEVGLGRLEIVTAVKTRMRPASSMTPRTRLSRWSH